MWWCYGGIRTTCTGWRQLTESLVIPFGFPGGNQENLRPSCTVVGTSFVVVVD